MNLPNKLTVLRVIMIPFFLFFLVFPGLVSDAEGNYLLARILAAAIFGLASFTDMLDGKIARKYGLVTDFGKFMDPLADKLLVFGAMLGLLVMNREDELFCSVFVWAAFVIILRELAVTSMRMVVSSAEGIVIAANIWGKMKTVSQIVGIIIIILEPIVWDGYIGSFVMMGLMVVTTLFSGFSYFKAYWPYINSNK
ncbi:MAG: CDP-diacylglycerol--glycerol-3-phosphate 3-phosphatidyltransferase [Clostridia bacterium]|nr:CDP-diacylglycerol--glycerol-3-phosphate 3-phosphatidyltransferase [Clostridia bacterium]